MSSCKCNACYDCRMVREGNVESTSAELSLKAEARIEELEEILRAFVNWTTPTEKYGSTSLLDDEELWKRAEEVLNK